MSGLASSAGGPRSPSQAFKLKDITYFWFGVDMQQRTKNDKCYWTRRPISLRLKKQSTSNISSCTWVPSTQPKKVSVTYQVFFFGNISDFFFYEKKLQAFTQPSMFVGKKKKRGGHMLLVISYPSHNAMGSFQREADKQGERINQSTLTGISWVGLRKVKGKLVSYWIWTQDVKSWNKYHKVLIFPLQCRVAVW